MEIQVGTGGMEIVWNVSCVHFFGKRVFMVWITTALPAVRLSSQFDANV